MTERPPAVAGTFYPAEPGPLSAEIRNYLAEAGVTHAENRLPKALIVPHAGYVYSGRVAASGYAHLQPHRSRIRRVVLLGPAHRVAVTGLAAPSVDAFRTPLGPVVLDRQSLQSLLDLPFVAVDDDAHAREHSLEVQLPFLQTVLDAFVLIPLVVGDATPAQVHQVLERLWGGPETVIIVSSDLTHFHDHATATRRDRQTADAIERLAGSAILREDACGRCPIQGLLASAQAHQLTSRCVDLRNSGDTAGPRDRVVGYGAFLFG